MQRFLMVPLRYTVKQLKVLLLTSPLMLSDFIKIESRSTTYKVEIQKTSVWGWYPGSCYEATRCLVTARWFVR